MYDYLTAELARFRVDEQRRAAERNRTGGRVRSPRRRRLVGRRIR